MTTAGLEERTRLKQQMCLQARAILQWVVVVLLTTPLVGLGGDRGACSHGLLKQT